MYLINQVYIISIGEMLFCITAPRVCHATPSQDVTRFITFVNKSSICLIKIVITELIVVFFICFEKPVMCRLIFSKGIRVAVIEGVFFLFNKD